MNTMKLIKNSKTFINAIVMILLIPISISCVAESKVLHHFSEGSEQGDATSKIILGLMYEYGIDINKNISLAKELYNQAAMAGLENGYVMLAHLYSRNSDNESALNLYRKVVESNEYKSLETVNLAMKDKTREQQFDSHLEAAKRGNPMSTSAVGIMYEIGYGVSSSMENAFYWYKKAAEAEQFGSQLNLGYLYHTGTGVQIDIQKAVYWYSKAAENITQMYMGGLNMAKYYLSQ